MPKVFILDDDELNNELVILLLNSVGIKEIEVRTSGEDAFKYLENCKISNSFPDIMFIDINMPGIKGLMFVDHYEKHYRKISPYCKVIMLTNSILGKEKEEALKHNSVFDYWNKPLTQKKLSEIFNEI